MAKFHGKTTFSNHVLFSAKLLQVPSKRLAGHIFSRKMWHKEVPSNIGKNHTIKELKTTPEVTKLNGSLALARFPKQEVR